MRRYQYVPFPELRQQYRRRQRLLKALADIAIAITISVAYGIMAGLMLAGLWIEFLGGE